MIYALTREAILVYGARLLPNTDLLSEEAARAFILVTPGDRGQRAIFARAFAIDPVATENDLIQTGQGEAARRLKEMLRLGIEAAERAYYQRIDQ